MIKRALPGQTFADIAIQVYGHIEGIGFLLEDNPQITVHDDLFVGQKIIVREQILDSDVVALLTNQKPTSS